MTDQPMHVIRPEAFAPEIDVGVWFTNVNTPDDFRAARELLAARNGLLPRASE